MKKNHRLFRDIGEIPDEYIDDALNGRSVVKHKNQNWKIILSAAAVFAVIAAVPAAVRFDRNNENAEDISPEVTEITAVSETSVPSVTAVPDGTDTVTEKEDNIVLYGSGPERTENYNVDINYSVVNLIRKTKADKEGAAELFDFINDKEIVNQIVDYIDYRSAYIISQMESELTASEREEIIDFYREMEFAKYYTCDIINIINGYMTVEVNSCVGFDRKQSDTYIFDIIDGKIIENYTDIFLSGVNISELIPGINDSETAQSNGYYGGESDRYGIRDEAYSFQKYYDYSKLYTKWNAGEGLKQNIIGSTVFSIYRDVSPAVSREVSEEQWTEWYTVLDYRTEIAGLYVSCEFEVSRFHSEAEILEKNRNLAEIYEAAINYVKLQGTLTGENHETEVKLRFTECEGILTDLYQITLDSTDLDMCVYVDPSDHSVTNADDLLKDWKEYIVKVYDNHNDDTEISDIEDYIITNIYHNSIYVIPDSDNSERESWESRPYVVVSEDEVDTFDMISFYLNAYNKNTKERVLIVVYLPVENVDGRYFSREGYSNVIRNWYLNH